MTINMFLVSLRELVFRRKRRYYRKMHDFEDLGEGIFWIAKGPSKYQDLVEYGLIHSISNPI